MNASWFADKIEQWPTAKLLPYARNARTHSDDQVAQIAASIAEFGFTNPILAGSDGIIVAGHGRLAAAQKLGLDVVPVVVLDHLSATQRRALVIADNRIAEKGGWDKEILGDELRWLLAERFDVSLTGWDLGEVRIAGEAAEDEGAGTVTVPGDVWSLGDSRVACGADEAAGAVLGAAKAVPGIALLRGVPAATGAALAAGCAVVYWWHEQAEAADSFDALEAAGYDTRAQIAAVHTAPAPGGRWRAQHVCAWYAVRQKATASWVGGRKQATVWQVEGKGLPLECWRRPMLNHTARGAAVLVPGLPDAEPLIAAASCGRTVLAWEPNPALVDGAIRRWEAYTGHVARDAEGRSFSDREAGLS